MQSYTDILKLKEVSLILLIKNDKKWARHGSFICDCRCDCAGRRRSNWSETQAKRRGFGVWHPNPGNAPNRHGSRQKRGRHVPRDAGVHDGVSRRLVDRMVRGHHDGLFNLFVRRRRWLAVRRRLADCSDRWLGLGRVHAVETGNRTARQFATLALARPEPRDLRVLR